MSGQSDSSRSRSPARSGEEREKERSRSSSSGNSGSLSSPSRSSDGRGRSTDSSDDSEGNERFRRHRRDDRNDPKKYEDTEREVSRSEQDTTEREGAQHRKRRASASPRGRYISRRSYGSNGSMKRISRGRGERRGEYSMHRRAVASSDPAYVPPFKLARMMKEAEEKGGIEYQKLAWDALRKSLNRVINKVNSNNIKHVLPEVFQQNLIRGSGLLCRALMRSQVTSPSFTPVYAALIAVVNTKFPEIGELLLHRIVAQFKRSYVQNDKQVCLSALTFLAHLINQQVVHELLALEILALLLEQPSDDSIDAASTFVKHCGAMLQDVAPAGLSFVFDRLRDILHEGIGVTKRAQYVIEGLYSMRRKGFEESGHPAVPPELDLVETEDQITHEVTLDSDLELHTELDTFREDPDYEAHEAEYNAIRKEILGDDEEEESTEESGESDSGEEEEEAGATIEAGGPIQDQTGTDLVNLRRTIYLTLQSSLDFEEAGHKLLKMGIPKGMEAELATMIIECCAQEKTFTKFYALLAERFCKLNKPYGDAFAECFITQYRLVHRLETNKLRNIARLFAHILATDALDWRVLAVIRLTEADTTSSSRIFIKILFQDLAENMGLRALNERLQDPTYEAWFQGLFPQDSMKNMRFSINFFTSIGLGGLTDKMREILADLPRIIAEKEAAAAAEAAKRKEEESSSGYTSSSSSGYGSSSRTSSYTESYSSSEYSSSSKSVASTSSSGTSKSRSRNSSRDSLSSHSRDSREGRRSTADTTRYHRRSSIGNKRQSISRSNRRETVNGDRRAKAETPPRSRSGRGRISSSHSRSPESKRSRSDSGSPIRRRNDPKRNQSLSKSPIARRKRSESHSTSPGPRRYRRRRSPSLSRSPTPRRKRSRSDSGSPIRRRNDPKRNQSLSKSPIARRKRSESHSTSPGPRRNRRRRSPSLSRSPRRQRSGSYSRSPIRRRNDRRRSPSLSRSPTPRREKSFLRSPGIRRYRDRRSPSPSRSPHRRRESARSPRDKNPSPYYRSRRNWRPSSR